MGLDAVELVMEIEEEFAISISDEEAIDLGVVGDLANFIVKKTAGTNTECNYDYALRRVISMLVESYGIPEGKAHAGSHVVQDLGLD